MRPLKITTALAMAATLGTAACNDHDNHLSPESQMEAVDAVPIETANSIENQATTYSPSIKYPFAETHGECYAILQMRKHEYDESSKPENFDNARNYFENRVIEEFNLQGANMPIDLMYKFHEYNDLLWEKYGPLQLSQTMASREYACILIAVTEFTPQ